MTLKHPKGPPTSAGGLSVAPIFTLENQRIPRHHLAAGELAPDPGSSEAAMLGGLALKRRWRQRRRAAGKPTGTPNLAMGINVQVCWERFANFWDVEMPLVSMVGDRFHLSAEQAVGRCDENTIGVVAVPGSTFDGS
jgi:hypothetical protein